jgi:YD repeat-containing protein
MPADGVGVASDLAYDDNNQLTSYNSSMNANDLTFTYDPDGNRATKHGEHSTWEHVCMKG